MSRKNVVFVNTGDRFGKLTVLSKADDDSRRVLCICDCGRKKYVDIYALNRGRVNSCGCLKQKRLLREGDVFGKLTVVEDNRGKLKGRNITCVCECGNYITISISNLHSKGLKSCGCVRHYKGERHFNALPKGEAAFNNLYKNYKDRATSRGLEFELTKSEFKLLTSSNCYYCGVEPFLKFSGSSGRNGDYTYNGVDRIDNDAGYTQSNSISCCKWCNQAKSNMSLDEFRNWVSRVFNNLIKGGN